MGLPRVHRARREVTFVSHKDHGNIIRILNTLNLFSALQNKKIENLVYFISLLLFLFLDTSKHFIQPQLHVCWLRSSQHHQQLHPWRTNHPGNFRTQRKSQCLPVLGCAALLKEGGLVGGWTTGRRQTALPHHYSSKCQMPCSQGGLSERRGSDHSISPAFLLNQPQYSLQYSQPNPSAVNTANGNYDNTCSEF